MKINELKRIAEENDYKLTEDGIHYKLTHKYFDNNITIDNSCKNQLWISIPSRCNERDFEMIKAAVEFAETPLEDRVEEKKFYAKHKWLVQAGDYKMGFLNYDTNNDILFIYSEHHTHLVKTHFTLKEIEEIKEKFNTDLADFELVEVEE